MTAPADLALFLHDEAHDLIRSRLRADSCLISTRVVLDVALVAGVPAVAQECNTYAANAEAAELVDAGVPFADWPPSAWSVGIRAGNTGGGWEGGHMVALLGRPGDRLLLDASAEQLARPHKGIVIPGGAILASWVEDPGGSAVEGPDGTRVTYTAVERRTRLGDRARDWHDPKRRRPFVAELVRRARAAGVIR